jgi:hypothetical protein
VKCEVGALTPQACDSPNDFLTCEHVRTPPTTPSTTPAGRQAALK